MKRFVQNVQQNLYTLQSVLFHIAYPGFFPDREIFVYLTVGMALAVYDVPIWVGVLISWLYMSIFDP